MIDGSESGGRLLLGRTPDVGAARWQRRSIGIRAKTSTATLLKGALVRCLATRWSLAGPGDLIFKPRNQWHTFLECRR
jgi:hypothetical protein